LSLPRSRPPPPPLALIFDLDGTLVDSQRDIAAACNVARGAHGLSPLPFEAVLPMIGDGARMLIARAFDAAEDSALVEAALGTFKASYLAHPCVHTVLLPGVREVLDHAAAAKLPCAVLTNKPRDVTLVLLEALGMLGEFRTVWGGGDGPLKPSPVGLVEVLARLDVAPGAAWMIGDGPQDVGAGKAAGVFTVGVPGIAERSRLVASQPDLLCESLHELRDVLARITADRA
jgi:phosphoglycolate phosphatase